METVVVKNQLHQLLAVESDLAQQAKAIIEETKNTFNKKQDHFDGFLKSYTPFDELGEKVEPEGKELQTTVSEKLVYAQEAVIRAIDATVSKEETNASGNAKAELKVNGKSFGIFSATSLLVLERYLTWLREEYKDIPTLDPAKSWKKDNQSGRSIYTTQPFVSYRVLRKNRPVVLAAATDKHPAQVNLVEEEVQVGKYSSVYSSGKLTPLEKSLLLGKIDALLCEVKITREKANQADVIQKKVGKEIFDFIHS